LIINLGIAMCPPPKSLKASVPLSILRVVYTPTGTQREDSQNCDVLSHRPQDPPFYSTATTGMVSFQSAGFFFFYPFELLVEQRSLYQKQLVFDRPVISRDELELGHRGVENRKLCIAVSLGIQHGGDVEDRLGRVKGAVALDIACLAINDMGHGLAVVDTARHEG